MNHVQENKSKVEDIGTESRDSKFFSIRTINTMKGGSEQDTKTIITELIGMKSHFNS